jgi:hypothetical protein
MQAFEGRLERVGIVHILESLLDQGTSGILLLGGAQHGRVVFVDGAVRAASLGDLKGPAALGKLLLLKSGPFRFEVVDPAAHTPQLLPGAQAEAAETFATRALRALHDARTRIFSPQPDGLLEIPRARDATPRPTGDSSL